MALVLYMFLVAGASSWDLRAKRYIDIAIAELELKWRQRGAKGALTNSIFTIQTVPFQDKTLELGICTNTSDAESSGEAEMSHSPKLVEIKTSSMYAGSQTFMKVIDVHMPLVIII